MYRKQVRRRRAVLVALIVALADPALESPLSEAESGPLHTVQRGVATVFAPVERGRRAGR